MCCVLSLFMTRNYTAVKWTIIYARKADVDVSDRGVNIAGVSNLIEFTLCILYFISSKLCHYSVTNMSVRGDCANNNPLSIRS